MIICKQIMVQQSTELEYYSMFAISWTLGLFAYC